MHNPPASHPPSREWSLPASPGHQQRLLPAGPLPGARPRLLTAGFHVRPTPADNPCVFAAGNGRAAIPAADKSRDVRLDSALQLPETAVAEDWIGHPP